MSKSNGKLKKSEIYLLMERYEETNNIKFRKKLYNMLLSSLDELSESYIRKLDTIIDKIKNNLMANGGWTVSRTGISNFSSKTYTAEDGVYTTLRVERDINGFHPQDVPESLQSKSTVDAERKFLAERKIELDIIHSSMLMKDDIMINRRYTLKNPEDAELVELLREFFNLNNRELTILPPQETPAKSELSL